MNKKTVFLFIFILVLFSLNQSVIFAEERTEVSIDFGKDEIENGIKLRSGGNTEIKSSALGREGRVLSATDDNSLFVYGNVDDSFLYDLPEDTPVDIIVEYFDGEAGASFTLDYDSHNPQPEFFTGNTIWRNAGICYLQGTGEWKTHTFHIEDAKMMNRCNGSTDFRIGTWSIFMRYSSADVLIGSVKVRKSSLIRDSKVNISSEKLGNIFSRDDTNIELFVDVFNRSDKILHTQDSVLIKNKQTLETVYQTDFQMTIEPKQTQRHTFSFINPQINGIYTIELIEKLYSDDNEVELKEATTNSEFSVVYAIDEEDLNPKFGQMSHVVTKGRGTPEEFSKLLTNVGGTWNRDEVPWDVVETEKGKYSIPQDMYNKMKIMSDNGINQVVICAFYNSLYDEGKTPFSDEGIEGYAKYCGFLAKELKGITNYFEIWNEYNIVNFNVSNEPPETYAKMIKAAYAEIKKANPDAVVIGISTAMVSIEWTRRVFDAGAYDYMDAVSIHPYDFSGSFREQKLISEGLELKELMLKYGELKPIFYSELGFSTVDGPADGFPDYMGYSQTEQASAKILANALVRANEICDYMIEYCFYDRDNQKDIEACWGLLYKWDSETDGKPKNGAKESYIAINAMNYLWGKNSDYKKMLSVDRLYAVNFYDKKFGRDVLVLATGDGETVINLNLGVNKVSVYDIYGNKETDLNSANGVYTFSVGKIPFYVIGNFGNFELTQEQGAVIPVQIENTVTASDKVEFIFESSMEGLIIEANPSVGLSVIENQGFNGKFAKIVFETSNDVSGQLQVHICLKDKNGNVFYFAKHCLTVKDAVSVNMTSRKTVELNSNHWAVQVTVKNNSKISSHSGKVELTQPLDAAQISNVRTFENLAPGKEVSFIFNLPVRISKRATSVSFEITLDSGAVFKAERTVEFTSARYTEKEPVIDGEISQGEWASNWFGADESKDVKQISNWQGADDLSFNATMMWDEKNLYFLGVVRDDIHCVTYSPQEPRYMYKGDCIQIGIDDRDVVPVMQENQFTEIGLADLSNGKSGVFRYKSLYELPEVCLIETAQIAVKHFPDYTVYECKIPWSELFYEGYIPSEEKTYRFSALTNDNDGYGRRGWIEYMSGIGLDKNAALFSKFTLTR